MQRSVKAMSEKIYDLIIVGGGITGACIAWDASLRGLKVAILEKNDFSSGTSSASSMLIHGGLRYLKTVELDLVRESLRERRRMSQIAPHLVYPLPFVLPTYHEKGKEKLPLIAGLKLYDLLAYDKTWLKDKGQQIPSFRVLSNEETLSIFPNIPQEKLTGGILYYDCQMFSPERLTLAFIKSAVQQGADVANYAEVVEFEKESNWIQGVRVRDRIAHRNYTIQGRLIVNASGPWADFLLEKIDPEIQKPLIRSKGIHLIIRSLSSTYSLAFVTRSQRHCFILPWRGYSLIGTTDQVYQGDPDHFCVTEQDIQEFIQEINDTYPALQLKRKDVLHYYGGLRPLVDEQTDVVDNTYSSSRKHEIYDHAPHDGIEGIMTVLGGKFTTSRKLAQKVVDTALMKLNRSAVRCTTHQHHLVGGNIANFTEFIQKNRERYSQFSQDITLNLSRTYGSEMDAFIQTASKNSVSLETVHPGCHEIWSQIDYAFEQEMARKLSDVVFRRTVLGYFGNPGKTILEKIANYAAKHQKWSKKRKEKELEEVLEIYGNLSQSGVEK